MSARTQASPEADFVHRFRDFDPDATFAHLRQHEYGRLDAHRQVYLDYTGAGLYPASQVTAHAELCAGDRCRLHQADPHAPAHAGHRADVQHRDVMREPEHLDPATAAVGAMQRFVLSAAERPGRPQPAPVHGRDAGR